MKYRDFFLGIKFDLFHRVDVNVVMVTNTVIFLLTSQKLTFTFLKEKITFLSEQWYFFFVFVTLIYTHISITDPTSVRVTTIFCPFKIYTKLKFLRFGCFIDIHIMNRTLRGCLGIRILSSFSP